jgi:hypothetical protein
MYIENSRRKRAGQEPAEILARVDAISGWSTTIVLVVIYNLVRTIHQKMQHSGFGGIVKSLSPSNRTIGIHFEKTIPAPK